MSGTRRIIMKLFLVLFLGVLSAIDAQIQIDTLPRKVIELIMIDIQHLFHLIPVRRSGSNQASSFYGCPPIQ